MEVLHAGGLPPCRRRPALGRKASGSSQLARSSFRPGAQRRIPMNSPHWIASAILFFSCVTAQAQVLDPGRIALLKWYDANQAASFDLSHPGAMAFDGTHLWITRALDGVVTKLRGSHRAILGPFPVTHNGLAIAFTCP